MEWDGKTIYDLLNFAKEETVKINVLRKEMENELERIKLIGKEPEVESEEVMKTMYIARDADGSLYLYLSRPFRQNGRWEIHDGEHFILENVDVKLPFITWESDPLEYRMLGTEKENDEIVGNVGNKYGGFSMDMRDLFVRYNVSSMKAINSESVITKNMIRGFVIGGDEI